MKKTPIYAVVWPGNKSKKTKCFLDKAKAEKHRDTLNAIIMKRLLIRLVGKVTGKHVAKYHIEEMVLMEEESKPTITYIGKRVETLEKGVCTNCNKPFIKRHFVSADLIRGKVTFDFVCSECGYEVTIHCNVTH